MTLEETRAAEVAQIESEREWLAKSFAEMATPENAELKAKLWDSLMLNLPSWLRLMGNGDPTLREEMTVPSHTSADFMLRYMTGGAAASMLRSQAIYTLLTAKPLNSPNPTNKERQNT